jgi:hypothetical protein
MGSTPPSASPPRRRRGNSVFGRVTPSGARCHASARLRRGNSLTRGSFLKTPAEVFKWREEFPSRIEPARARAVESLTLERTLGDLVNRAYGRTPAEIELIWRTAWPRMPVAPDGT